MKLSGNAALGVWHSVEPGFEQEVEKWYINEHYHDRVVIDGFLRARGYKNLSGNGSLYFSRYDAQDIKALSCDQYLYSLKNPSSWSQSIFKSYKNTRRGAFVVHNRWAIGAGGYLLSVRMDDGHESISSGARKEISDAVSLLQGIDGVVAVESWFVDAETSTIKTTEQEIRGQQDQYPQGALLVDLMEPSVVETILNLVPDLASKAEVDVMKLTYQLTKGELILPRPH